MKKINIKKVMLFLFVLVLLISISSISFAGLESIKPDVSGPGTTQIKSVAGIVLGIMQVVAVAVAVIMLVVIAIKYIAASPSEKGDIKKALLYYALGAVLLFASAGVMNFISNFAGVVNKQLGLESSITIISEKNINSDILI